MLDPQTLLFLGGLLVAFVCGICLEKPVMPETIGSNPHDTLTALAVADADAKTKAADLETKRQAATAAEQASVQAKAAREAARQAHFASVNAAFPTD